MSSIYILEPPTSGKVLLKTSVGDIDVELWAKETPKTCRNFIQLCMDGYYNNTIFHRVVKNFIVQGGDPNGDGTGGQSIYEEPFKDEFHQRLKFVRRGLLAMANAGKNDNGSQFFFTLGATPELQNVHTIFGKVTGETVFNMLKLEEGLIEGERPVYPHKILKTVVLNNPFPDIVPRVTEETKTEKAKKEKKKGVKDFKLLSFGEEAEEDEEEVAVETKKYVGKAKSMHDTANDPKLSSEPIEIQNNDDDDDEGPNLKEQLENIRKKLKTSHKSKTIIINDNDDFQEEEIDEKQKKKEEIQKQIQSVKQEYQKNRLIREQEQKEQNKEHEAKNQVIQAYKDEFDKYETVKKTLPRKGSSREEFTLKLLDKFKKKLSQAKGHANDDDEEAEEEEAEQETEIEKSSEPEENKGNPSWMSHVLHFEEKDPVLAKDANTKGDDWFEIYDPRNALNKRRRGEAAHVQAVKKA